MANATMSPAEYDIQTILGMLEDLWLKDELRPGLTLAYVDKGQTYAAIVRWPKRDIKRVEISFKGASLKAAVAKVKSLLVRYVDEGRANIPYVSTLPPVSDSPPPGWSSVAVPLPSRP